MPPEMVSESLRTPQSPAQSPGQLPQIRATRKKDRKRLNNGSCRNKRKQPKESTSRLINKSRINGEAEFITQSEESLRWEGVLEDAQAEEKRLELYRANRRQRYIAHRKALSKDNQVALSLENKERNALVQSERQVAASLLNLGLN